MPPRYGAPGAAHAAPRRRLRIWKIVVIAVLFAAIGEPLFMYHMLVLQKEKRQSAELAVPAAAHAAATE